jgi:hypothetical protein
MILSTLVVNTLMRQRIIQLMGIVKIGGWQTEFYVIG